MSSYFQLKFTDLHHCLSVALHPSQQFLSHVRVFSWVDPLLIKCLAQGYNSMPRHLKTVLAKVISRRQKSLP